MVVGLLLRRLGSGLFSFQGGNCVMGNTKYIVVRIDDQFDSNRGEEFAIVFPKELTHRDVARVHRVGQNVVISAGFCSRNKLTGEWSAYGRSESLGMESRPEDSVVLNKLSF